MPKAIDSFTNHAIEKFVQKSKARTLALELLLLTLLSLFCRLPFFFESVIDWDESTFILVGQSILDGYLPYTQLWELKPPLAFGAYALIILLFGKTIASVRVAGALFVALVAFVVNRTTQRLSTVLAGRLSGVLTVLLLSVLPSGQAVMSEHIAVLPMVVALYLLVKKGITPMSAFYCGLLLSTAAMVRLNTAYVAVAIGLYLMLIAWQQALSRQMRCGLACRGLAYRGLAYLGGGAIPIFCSFAPYRVAGIPQVWWNSVVMASVDRANMITVNRARLAAKADEVSPPLWDRVLDEVLKLDGFILQLLIGVGAIAIVRLLLKRRAKMHPPQMRGWLAIVVFIWALQYSILTTGWVHLHYLLQFVPFLATGLAVWVAAAIYRRRQLIIVVVLALCLGAYSVFDQYATILPRLLTGAPLDQSLARQTADYFITHGLEERSIYMASDHIAYWYIGSYPLTRSTTHPSTISRDYLLQVLHGPNWSSSLEMQRLLSLKPEYIVKRDWLFYLEDEHQSAEILQTALDQDYALVHNIEELSIYARKTSAISTEP